MILVKLKIRGGGGLRGLNKKANIGLDLEQEHTSNGTNENHGLYPSNGNQMYEKSSLYW